MTLQWVRFLCNIHCASDVKEAYLLYFLCTPKKQLLSITGWISAHKKKTTHQHTHARQEGTCANALLYRSVAYLSIGIVILEKGAEIESRAHSAAARGEDQAESKTRMEQERPTPSCSFCFCPPPPKV